MVIVDFCQFQIHCKELGWCLVVVLRLSGGTGLYDETLRGIECRWFSGAGVGLRQRVLTEVK